MSQLGQVDACGKKNTPAQTRAQHVSGSSGGARKITSLTLAHTVVLVILG